MSFNWAEYLILADTLFIARAKFPHEEACFRTAISRAYYAAFCEARNHARKEGLTTLDGTGKDHGRVAEYYRGLPIEFRQQIGLRLERLRLDRNRADYDNAMGRVDSICEASLRTAREVLDYLKKI